MAKPPSPPTADSAAGASPGRRRSAARLAAVQALYQGELTGSEPDLILRDILEGRIARQAITQDPDDEEREVSVPLVAPDADLLTAVVRIATARRGDIDGMIDKALSADWSADRLEAVVRCILRAGVSELLERGDVPVRVVITEYVDVAHAFYSGSEPGLVNAVLDRLGRLIRGPEFGGPGGGGGSRRPEGERGPAG